MNMNFENKMERGRERIRSLKLNKDKKKRSITEHGRLNIGNNTKKFCRWCRPKLYNRLIKKKIDKIYLEKNIE